MTFNQLEETDLFNSNEFIQWHELWQERLTRQDESKADSQQLMQNSNPAIIPRNHRVEEAIEAAVENGDYSVMENLLNILSNPYTHSEEQTDFNTVPVESNQPYRTFCGT